MRLSILFVLFLFIVSCSNEETATGILDQPPYQSLTDSIRQFPREDVLYYKRGVILYQSNEKQLAENDIRHAWTLSPKEEYALSLTTLLKEKSPDSAVLFLEQATQKLPQSVALKVGLARGYQARGQSEKALTLTDSIIKQYPGQLDALAIKAEVLHKEEKKDESILVLEHAYSLVPSDPQLAYDLAFAYAETANKKIIPLTDSLIKAGAPEIEKAYYTRGLYFSHVKNAAQAISNYDLAIRANYNFLDAYRDKGEVLFHQKKYDEALQAFELGLKVNPAVGEFYYWLGRIHEAKGNKKEAEFNYLKAEKLKIN